MNVPPQIIVIGAGIGGLTSAIQLAASGYSVRLFDRHQHVGGKIRTSMSDAGPVDAGPTVLTMRHIFDELLGFTNGHLEDHIHLIPQDILARHFWTDGSTLDLYANIEASARAIKEFSGSNSEQEFLRYCHHCRELFQGFYKPMMRAAEPRFSTLIFHVFKNPSLIRKIYPGFSLARSLSQQFSDPRLAQLFGRYATYVGGSPFLSPAILSLIWHAEASGVWIVQGGMHKLAAALAKLATTLGVEIRLGNHVDRIVQKRGRVHEVVLRNTEQYTADAVIFNGDPRALAVGSLGKDFEIIARHTIKKKRSYSARVYSFAAKISGNELAHHNVLFDDNPASEFNDLQVDRIPNNPTLYICAQDRGQGIIPPILERFEIIANAPAGVTINSDKELEQWNKKIIRKLNSFDITFDPAPMISNITTPYQFHQLFPESLGALYGQSPHGLLAAFTRPTARTKIPGLYLAGGGTHPGAGLPMAAISGMHAAEAITSDLTLTSMSAPMVTRGGISTG
ncbi:MAG: phytoene desaturase family protein [Aestuariivita sp.]|nr:phytoene desaturase family protein [Aestuariivita sp.]